MGKMKYWFKPKWYGYGFYPVTWEGWLATFTFIAIIFLSGLINNIFSETGATTEEGIRFVLDVLIFSGLATLFFEKKMKEPLKWRWGRKK